ncbi:unnamed protein product [Allacma fusca]|uniref:F-box domain-containing protein n=1 Tax=Allacma fusca TaxID=39272 RepID=A0A8J2LHB1_9HEXA|nr:unnamed protein product [Allacma fusca]
MLQLFQTSFPDVRSRILKHLDEATLLRFRLVCRQLREIVDGLYSFDGKLNDRKLRCSVLSWTPLSLKSGFLWDAVEEIVFTRAVTSQNYHTVLKACGCVSSIRINYLAIGGQRKKNNIFRRLFHTKPDLGEVDSNYFLPNLKSIHVDRGLDTAEFIENRNQNKYKHFDADLYFRTMANLIDDLEKEVQNSILEILREEQERRGVDDPNSGFFFTKPRSVNRFPMRNRILNVFAVKLRPA